MDLTLVTLLILLVLVVLFVFLAIRAGHARAALVRWPGMILAGLLALVLVAVTGVVGLGYYRLNVAPGNYSVSTVQVSLDADKVARGERLAGLCADCHSSTGNLPLDGGKANLLAQVPMPLGVVWPPNLTPGGPLKNWSDGQIMRALREGIDANGRPLFGMPSVAFHNLSDADAEAVVAFLRSQPAVDRTVPARDLSPLAAVFVGIGMAPPSTQAPITAPIVAPPAGTAGYGQYIANSLGCTDCHGLDLAGTATGLGPKGPNLTAIVPKMSQADFLNVFHNGVDPTGRPISDVMPWKHYGAALTDSELSDVYTFMHGLPLITNTAQ